MKLLCIDDSLTFRVFLKYAVKQNWPGSDVVDSAEKGLLLIQEAIEQGSPIDGFLLDIEMGPPNGFDVARSIREIPEHEKTPIFFLSASSNPEEISLSKKLGSGIIPKHEHEMEELVDVINDLVSNKLSANMLLSGSAA